MTKRATYASFPSIRLRHLRQSPDDGERILGVGDAGNRDLLERKGQALVAVPGSQSPTPGPAERREVPQGRGGFVGRDPDGREGSLNGFAQPGGERRGGGGRRRHVGSGALRGGVGAHSGWGDGRCSTSARPHGPTHAGSGWTGRRSFGRGTTPASSRGAGCRARVGAAAIGAPVGPHWWKGRLERGQSRPAGRGP